VSDEGFVEGAAELRVWFNGEWLRIRGVVESLDVKTDYGRPILFSDGREVMYLPAERHSTVVIRSDGTMPTWKKDRAGKPVMR
jgi:hypothetical protein